MEFGKIDFFELEQLEALKKDIKPKNKWHKCHLPKKKCPYMDNEKIEICCNISRMCCWMISDENCLTCPAYIMLKVLCKKDLEKIQKKVLENIGEEEDESG